jgi:hypothetical protein
LFDFRKGRWKKHRKNNKFKKGRKKKKKKEKNEGFPRPGGDFVAPGINSRQAGQAQSTKQRERNRV